MAGILTQLLTLPYAPVRVLTAVARVLQREAERELTGSAGIHRQLDEIDAAAAGGELSAEERERAEQAVVARLINRPDTQA
jgi:Gas vesicle protein G